VEFFQGATKLGEDATAPYSFEWTSVAAGTYSITAKATDNSGLSTTSQAISVTVSNPAQPQAPVAPTVNLISLTRGNFTAPASINLVAEAADRDGTVAKVEFFNGNIKIGEATSAPYSFTWTNVAAGTYMITARATDNSGLTSTSQRMEVIVELPATVRKDGLSVYPNPVQTSATIEFSLPQNAYVSLALFDMKGAKLAVLFAGLAESNKTYKIPLDASKYRNGVYVCRLSFDDGKSFIKKTIQKKIVVAK
jgi:PKD repeat protein